MEAEYPSSFMGCKVYMLCITPDLQHSGLGRDPIPNSISLVLGALQFFERNPSVGPKQSMYHRHPSVEKTADPILSTLQPMYTEQPG